MSSDGALGSGDIFVEGRSGKPITVSTMCHDGQHSDPLPRSDSNFSRITVDLYFWVDIEEED